MMINNYLFNKIYNKDARNILEILNSKIKINTTITSPPYFDMKDYDSENQVGYGQTYSEYLDDLQKIFHNIFTITEEDGSLWIVIDTFKRNGEVIPLPFDLSNKLKAVGWLLQDIIIWKKDKTIPWSNNGFMQRKFEYILFFTKSNKYKSNKDSVREYDTNHLKKWWVKYPERYNPKGKALDEVWEFPIPVQGSWGDKYIRHFCPLPKDMVATMILLSTDENDIVFDPFAGSGSVLAQALYMKRKYIGFELNDSYIEMFQNYVEATLSGSSEEYELLKKNNNQQEFQEAILNLRALKYAKVLLVSLEKQTGNKDFKIFVIKKNKSKIKNKLINVDYQFFGGVDESIFKEIIGGLIIKQPLSKFGIEPSFIFLKSKKIKDEKHFRYSKTNTHSYLKDKNIFDKHSRIISEICVDFDERDYL